MGVLAWPGFKMARMSVSVKNSMDMSLADSLQSADEELPPPRPIPPPPASELGQSGEESKKLGSVSVSLPVSGDNGADEEEVLSITETGPPPLGECLSLNLR